MASAQPYTISIPDAAINKLKRKLSDADFPDEFDAPSQWPYGSPLADIKRLAKHWETQFSWRDVETDLNKLPNYHQSVEVEIFDPIDVHFVWKKSTNPNAISLLFVHGWPGSFIEVKKLLPLLEQGEEEDKPAFHVVAPSLPNLGFSSKVRKAGFALSQYADMPPVDAAARLQEVCDPRWRLGVLHHPHSGRPLPRPCPCKPHQHGEGPTAKLHLSTHAGTPACSDALHGFRAERH